MTYLTSVLESGNLEALGLTEVGAGLDGHVVGGDGCTSEDSAINFLDTSRVGVSTGGSLLVGVGVDLDSVGAATSGGSGSRTGGNTLSGGG